MRLLLALLLLPGLAFGAQPTPEWALGRDGSGAIQVNGGPLGTVTFEEEWENSYPLETSNASCVPVDRVAYDWTVDGYEGRGPGSCLTRGACPNFEDRDLAHPSWSNSNFRHVVVKNWNIQNAFKTTIPPHVDVTQVLDSPGFGGWFVIQDSVLRNSDDGIVQLQFGYTTSDCAAFEGRAKRDFAGMVLHNVDIGNDSSFIADCQTRPGDSVCVQGNTVGSWNGPNEGWFINVQNDGWPLRLHQNWEKVVIVGNMPELTFRTSPAAFAFSTDNSCIGNPCSYGNRVFGPYPNIEAAIAAGHTEPPFVRLSCSGWADPSNCEQTQVIFTSGFEP